MKTFTENRKKIIIKNCIAYVMISLIFIFAIDYFRFREIPFSKAFFFIFFGTVGVILSSRKKILNFEDNQETLTITNKHILGDYKKTEINYKDLSFELKEKCNYSKLFRKKTSLKIYSKSNEIALIDDLDNFSNSNELREIVSKY